MAINIINIIHCNSSDFNCIEIKCGMMYVVWQGEKESCLAGRERKVIGVLTACSHYNGHEGLCSLVNFDLRTAIINTENALIDAVTASITTGTCYMATFLVDDRLI